MVGRPATAARRSAQRARSTFEHAAPLSSHCLLALWLPSSAWRAQPSTNIHGQQEERRLHMTSGIATHPSAAGGTCVRHHCTSDGVFTAAGLRPGAVQVEKRQAKAPRGRQGLGPPGEGEQRGNRAGRASVRRASARRRAARACSSAGFSGEKCAATGVSSSCGRVGSVGRAGAAPARCLNQGKPQRSAPPLLYSCAAAQRSAFTPRRRPRWAAAPWPGA